MSPYDASANSFRAISTLLLRSLETPVNRRNLLATAVSCLIGRRLQHSIELASARRSFSSGFALGSLVNEADLRDPVRTSIYQQFCARFTIAGPIYALYSQPSPGDFALAPATALASTFSENGSVVRGHALIWHRLTPGWLLGADRTPAGVLPAHVDAVVRTLKPFIVEWDVVNEPLDVNQGDRHSLRRSIWYELVGSDYIEAALHAAAHADPSAKLGINEYFLETDSVEGSLRRVAMLNLLRRLKSNGAPLHYVGLQAHLRTTDIFSRGGVGRFVREVREMGLAVHVTELDVRDFHPDSRPHAIDERVVSTIARFFDASASDGALDSVTTWGLFDDTSWLQSSYPRRDGVPQRPLPFSSSHDCKPMCELLRSVASVPGSAVLRRDESSHT